MRRKCEIVLLKFGNEKEEENLKMVILLVKSGTIVLIFQKLSLKFAPKTYVL